MQVCKKKHRDTQKEKRMNKIIERSKQRSLIFFPNILFNILVIWGQDNLLPLLE